MEKHAESEKNTQPLSSASIKKTRKCKEYAAFVSSNTIYDAKRRSGVFIVNFEHISHLVLVFLLLTLNM